MLREIPTQDRFYEEFFERYHVQMCNLLDQLQAAQPGKICVWERVKAARLKRIWLDFGRTGVIRDEKGLAEIADQFLDNIARLQAATELMGHTNLDPIQTADDHGYELTPELNERMCDFFTDENGAWAISDYAVDKLLDHGCRYWQAETPEDQIYQLDRMLNVIHCRSDLASLFIEGGSETLRQIANQGGYATAEQPNFSSVSLYG